MPLNAIDYEIRVLYNFFKYVFSTTSFFSESKHIRKFIKKIISAFVFSFKIYYYFCID